MHSSDETSKQSTQRLELERESTASPYRFNWTKLLAHVRSRPSHHASELDTRNVFEQDYHRIIMSASFRRLQDKTQVFPLDRSDFIRTRLTHSLEVSSLARSLGQAIAHEVYFRSLDPGMTAPVVTEICDLLLAAGLLHDIGNPPFGHYGETTIRDWFAVNLSRIEFNGQTLDRLLTPQMQADFLNFEGNAQALRLLTKLHFLVDEHGMNLTIPTLATLIKYPQRSTEVDPNHSDISRRKMGYFFAEEELFARICEITGTGNRRHPLTYILEAADDISYRTADIEDAFKKHHFTFGELREQLYSSRHLEGASEGQKDIYLRQVQMLERLREEARIKKYEKPELYAVQNWVIRVQSQLITASASSFCDHYSEIMNGSFTGDILHEPDGGLMLETLGDIAVERVFRSRTIVQMEISAHKIISSLLDQFIPACIYWDTDVGQTSLEPRLMSIVSDNYKQAYFRNSEGADEVTKLYLRLLLITDYICGMTDTFAKDLYQQMNGI